MKSQNAQAIRMMRSQVEIEAMETLRAVLDQMHSNPGDVANAGALRLLAGFANSISDFSNDEGARRSRWVAADMLPWLCEALRTYAENGDYSAGMDRRLAQLKAMQDRAKQAASAAADGMLQRLLQQAATGAIEAAVDHEQ